MFIEQWCYCIRWKCISRCWALNYNETQIYPTSGCEHLMIFQNIQVHESKVISYMPTIYRVYIIIRDEIILCYYLFLIGDPFRHTCCVGIFKVVMRCTRVIRTNHVLEPDVVYFSIELFSTPHNTIVPI